MFDFFRKQKWALVKTIKTGHPGTSNIYHIHCFESSIGNRRIEFVLNGEEYDPHEKKNTRVWILTTDLYQTQLYRWLNGRRDPEFPTYDQLPEEDTANFLKGKVV